MKTKSIKLLAMSDLHITDPDKQLQLRIGAPDPTIDLVIIAGDLIYHYLHKVFLKKNLKKLRIIGSLNYGKN